MKNRMKRTPYLGSIRFFKHLILTVFALIILVPTTLCVVLGVKAAGLEKVITASLAVSSGVSASIQESDGDVSSQETENVAFPAWQALYPELYAPPIAERHAIQSKTVYLTFDDGPSARTPEILRILAQYQAKATFFVVGKQDEQSKQWMRDIVAGGHTIGIHSYTHNYAQVYSSVESFLEDYNRMFQLIYEATGVYPAISRFPGGSINSYNSATYQPIIAELIRRGFVFYDWNAANGDATGVKMTTAKLKENALKGVNLRHPIVLMHDSSQKTKTVEALPEIIEGYQAAGFTCAALTPETAPVVFAYKE